MKPPEENGFGRLLSVKTSAKMGNALPAVVVHPPVASVVRAWHRERLSWSLTDLDLQELAAFAPTLQLLLNLREFL